MDSTRWISIALAAFCGCGGGGGGGDGGGGDGGGSDGGRDMAVAADLAGGGDAAAPGLGVPNKLIADPGSPSVLAIDATTLYWLDLGSCSGDGALVKAPKGGGALSTLAPNLGCPGAIALDDANVYFTDLPAGRVLQVPKAGGSPTPIATGETLGNAGYLAVDATSIYWGAGSDLRVAPKGGGAAKTLITVTGNVSGIAPSGTVLYFADSRDQGAIVSFDQAQPNQPPATLAGAQAIPFQVALDATSVYWVDGGNSGGVGRVARDGSGQTQLTAGANLLGLAVDATDVYFGSKSLIGRVPIGGGGASTQPLDTFSGSVALDATTLYVAGRDGIYTVPK